MVNQPTRKGSTIKLFAFVLLTLAGLGVGLLVAASTPLGIQSDLPFNLAVGAVSGTVAGMFSGWVALRLAGGSSDKEKD